MTEKTEEHEEQNKKQRAKKFNYIHKLPVLRTALHGMSEMINTRLSSEALDICLELIEAGVHPKALAEVVLHVLDAKQKHVIGHRSPYD